MRTKLIVADRAHLRLSPNHLDVRLKMLSFFAVAKKAQSIRPLKSMDKEAVILSFKISDCIMKAAIGDRPQDESD